MKELTTKFDTKGQCPLWCCDTGECGHNKGPVHCGSEAMDEPSGHCPCEDVKPTGTNEGELATCDIKDCHEEAFHCYCDEHFDSVRNLWINEGLKQEM